jgi:hypothetical protein
MTPEEFRTIALGFPGAVESEHMDHPDFRFNGRVFATLGYPDDGCGMVKLTPAQQGSFIGKAPSVFDRSSGAWGKAGSTIVRLERAKKPVAKAALQAAFNNIVAVRKKA